jgi:hypothetical protein
MNLFKLGDRWCVSDEDGNHVGSFATMQEAAVFADVAPLPSPSSTEATDGGDGTDAGSGVEDATETTEDPTEPQGPITPWSGPITFEGRDTSDGRHIEPGALVCRQLPLPFMLQCETDEKHKGARIQGRMDTCELQGDTWFATGIYIGYTGAEGAELARTKQIPGVSADIAASDIEMVVVELDDEGMPLKYVMQVNAGEIMGLTQTPFPAFADAIIEVGETTNPDPDVYPVGGWADEVALTASAAPVKPPLAWFANPNLSGPTPLTVTDDGQVYGHIATWGVCHIGRDDVCLTAPSSPSNYAYFLVGEVETAEGAKVPTGTITLNTSHAAMSAGAAGAVAHYDHTGCCAADLNCGEDEFGIWVAGAARPGLDDDSRRTFLASAPSGDWRKIRGNLELVGVLMVNTPGFPTPRASLVASGDGTWQEVALVAAAAPRPAEPKPNEWAHLPKPLLELGAALLDREVLGARPQ